MNQGLVLCAALRAETGALRAGLPPTVADRVVRTGVGRSRAERAATSAPVRHASALLVAGVAGGLRADLRPGDVVVADEVRTVDGGSVHCTSARLLAARLRAAGLTVRVGPVVSCEHVVGAAERATLAATRALAVDMESAWLVGSATIPTAVVRVVADTAGEPLLRPATLGRVRSALRRLTDLGPALADWGNAVGDRTVLLAGPRSFCAGVERAIDVVDLALQQRGAPVYVRKQIVHNVHVVAELEQRGAVFVDELDEVPAEATVVFSAHGVAPAVRDDARSRGLAVVDATCPLVSKVHAEVRRFSDRGDTVLFIGHAGHEETVGTMGERPGRTVLVEDVDDARSVQVADPDQVSYLVQTTLAADEVGSIVDVLRQRFPTIQGAASEDICYATTNRQRALRAVAEDSAVVLVVGSLNSSNSLRLVEAAQRMGTPAHLIDDVDGVNLRWLGVADTVGITAGASAPTTLIDEVIDALAGLGRVHVEERQVTIENVHFTLPKEVRNP